jgi:hypothetical protein
MPIVSGVKTDAITIGKSTTDSQNFQIAAENDGTLTIARGSDGSLGDILNFGASGELGIAGASYGTAGQVLKSNGTGVAPSWQTQTNPVTTQIVTDSTDITVALYPSTQSNVGSSFSVGIPTTGVIRLAGLTLRWLNNATATAHNLFMGIRIGTTNYWFNYMDNNGAVGYTNIIAGGAVASTYKETRGSAFSGAGTYVLDILASSIPTGTQTVQLIAGYETTQGTIKGTTITTRAVLEFIG